MRSAALVACLHGPPAHGRVGNGRVWSFEPFVPGHSLSVLRPLYAGGQLLTEDRLIVLQPNASFVLNISPALAV